MPSNNENSSTPSSESIPYWDSILIRCKFLTIAINKQWQEFHDNNDESLNYLWKDFKDEKLQNSIYHSFLVLLQVFTYPALSSPKYHDEIFLENTKILKKINAELFDFWCENTTITKSKNHIINIDALPKLNELLNNIKENLCISNLISKDIKINCKTFTFTDKSLVYGLPELVVFAANIELPELLDLYNSSIKNTKFIDNVGANQELILQSLFSIILRNENMTSLDNPTTNDIKILHESLVKINNFINHTGESKLRQANIPTAILDLFVRTLTAHYKPGNRESLATCLKTLTVTPVETISLLQFKEVPVFSFSHFKRLPLSGENKTTYEDKNEHSSSRNTKYIQKNTKIPQQIIQEHWINFLIEENIHPELCLKLCLLGSKNEMFSNMLNQITLINLGPIINKRLKTQGKEIISCTYYNSDHELYEKTTILELLTFLTPVLRNIDLLPKIDFEDINVLLTPLANKITASSNNTSLSLFKESEPVLKLSMLEAWLYFNKKQQNDLLKEFRVTEKVLGDFFKTLRDFFMHDPYNKSKKLGYASETQTKHDWLRLLKHTYENAYKDNSTETIPNISSLKTTYKGLFRGGVVSLRPNGRSVRITLDNDSIGMLETMPMRIFVDFLISQGADTSKRVKLHLFSKIEPYKLQPFMQKFATNLSRELGSNQFFEIDITTKSKFGHSVNHQIKAGCAENFTNKFKNIFFILDEDQFLDYLSEQVRLTINPSVEKLQYINYMFQRMELINLDGKFITDTLTLFLDPRREASYFYSKNKLSQAIIKRTVDRCAHRFPMLRKCLRVNVAKDSRLFYHLYLLNVFHQDSSNITKHILKKIILRKHEISKSFDSEMDNVSKKSDKLGKFLCGFEPNQSYTMEILTEKLDLNIIKDEDFLKAEPESSSFNFK